MEYTLDFWNKHVCYKYRRFNSIRFSYICMSTWNLWLSMAGSRVLYFPSLEFRPSPSWKGSIIARIINPRVEISCSIQITLLSTRSTHSMQPRRMMIWESKATSWHYTWMNPNISKVLTHWTAFQKVSESTSLVAVSTGIPKVEIPGVVHEVVHFRCSSAESSLESLWRVYKESDIWQRIAFEVWVPRKASGSEESGHFILLKMSMKVVGWDENIVNVLWPMQTTRHNRRAAARNDIKFTSHVPA